MTTLAERWRALPRRERLGWPAAALLVLSAALLGPVTRACSERWALAMAAGGNFTATISAGGALRGESADLDPWGRPLIITALVGPYAGPTCYSVGPNGVDEGGQGDDRAVPASDRRAGRVLHTLPMALLWLSLVVAWCLRGLYVHLPRAPSAALELWRGAVAVSVPALFLPLVLLLATGGKGGVGEEALDPQIKRWAASNPSLLLTPEAALLLTYPFAALGAGWAWRLTRPREGGDADAC